MNSKILVFCTALFLTLLVTIPQVAIADGGNLLIDASFEQRISPDKGGWILFDESMYSAEKTHSGKQSMFHWGYSRSVPYPPHFIGTVSGSFQELPAKPGSQWRLTGYAAVSNALKGAATFGVVQVSFFDAEGKDLGTTETAGDSTLAKISNKIDNRTSAGEWVLLDTGIATAPEGTATIQAFTLYVDYSGSDTTQGVYFDDLNLCVVGDISKCN